MPLTQRSKARIVVIVFIVIMVLPVAYGLVRRYLVKDIEVQSINAQTAPAR